MEYAIPAALVLLVITGLIVLLVMRSTSKATSRADDDGGPGIGPDEQTPLADTNQHAGQQRGGETVAGADAGEAGGAGRRHGQGYEGTAPVGADAQDPEEAAHVQRPGEGEGAARI
jgi:hypothetical protein